MTKETIEHIAKLARLKLTDQELKTFGDQFSSILYYVKKLQEVDTEGVPEFMHAASGSNVFRDDVVERCEKSTQDLVVESFPQRMGSLMEVKAVFDHKQEE